MTTFLAILPVILGVLLGVVLIIILHFALEKVRDNMIKKELTGEEKKNLRRCYYCGKQIEEDENYGSFFMPTCSSCYFKNNKNDELIVDTY